MDNLLLDGFTLDGILVEPVTGQYASPTRSGHLPPRAVEVLLHLAKHPRRLVTREAILFTTDTTVSTFKARILGPYKVENVPIEIHEKEPASDKPTIRGKSTAGERIFTVTEADDPPNDNKDNAFWVGVPVLGELYPMDRIIRQGGSTRQLQYNDLLNALEELDIDPDAVTDLLMEFGGQTQTAE